MRWLKDISTPESSWLKSPGLKGLGLKLGVEKSEIETSFNHILNLLLNQGSGITYLWLFKYGHKIELFFQDE